MMQVGWASNANESAVNSANRDISALQSRAPKRSPPCRLRIFLYTSHLHYLRQQQRSGHIFGFSTETTNDGGSIQKVSCLEAPCSFDTFIRNNTRQYTGEVPVYHRLVNTCQLTTDPSKADVFLVPFFFGYMMTLGWSVGAYGIAGRAEHREMMRAAVSIGKSLPHLNNNTAARHIFLFSCDSQFLGVDLAPYLRDSIVVHLGDDAYAGNSGDLRHAEARQKRHLPNGVIVPYRVSQWLPFGFRPAAVGPRRLLISMNVNMARHRVRSHIATHIRAAAKLAAVSEDRLYITSQMAGPIEAAEIARSSTFCVCPTGDSKGFTARFYFSLLHGCLPVRVDGWRRNAEIAPPTYPFPHLIKWSRIVIDLHPDNASTQLLPLLQMPTSEVEERQSYLHHVAHYLLYDVHAHAHHDAPAAVINELEGRFGLLDAARPTGNHGRV